MPATKIIDHVSAEHCIPALQGATREDVIRELARSFVDTKVVSAEAQELIVESVLEREEAATTGIGNGIALPHPKTTEDVGDLVAETLIAVGLHPDGVDFAALDGDPVYIVFLVVSPGKHEYLEVAKRIAALAKGGSTQDKWRRVLRGCKTGPTVREALEEAWEELAP
ncbi:MAG: PTS sugar transporter subunit IIA [Planctomycetota bacterium]|jgi:mannitol/fructose-specific phosphotransferase system IIA component (Ntr-type)